LPQAKELDKGGLVSALALKLDPKDEGRIEKKRIVEWWNSEAKPWIETLNSAAAGGDEKAMKVHTLTLSFNYVEIPTHGMKWGLKVVSLEGRGVVCKPLLPFLRLFLNLY